MPTWAGTWRYYQDPYAGFCELCPLFYFYLGLALPLPSVFPMRWDRSGLPEKCLKIHFPPSYTVYLLCPDDQNARKAGCPLPVFFSLCRNYEPREILSCAAVATWKKGRVDTVKMRLFLPSTIVSLGSVVYVGSQSNSQVLRFSQRCSCLWTFARKTFYGGKRTSWDLLVCHLTDITFIYL